MPAPKIATTIARRIKVGSTSKYSPSPPQIPAIILSSPERYKRFSTLLPPFAIGYSQITIIPRLLLLPIINTLGKEISLIKTLNLRIFFFLL